MLGYLSESTFVWKLIYDIIMWIVILSIVFYCIKRNPTDYDTNYRKRYRTIMGVLCILGAVGLMFINQKNVLLPNYYLSTFGTLTPNETMIQYGMGPNVPMREAGVEAVFALPTFEQWLILIKVKSFSVWMGFGIMFLFFKKSSTRPVAKVRKAFGYLFLLFLVPATLASHNFFDWEEFLFTGIAILMAWLLLRTYRKDAIAPTLPEESKQHSENKDFAPIEPETCINDSRVTSGDRVFCFANKEKNQEKKTKCLFKASYNYLSKIFLALSVFFFLFTVPFLMLEKKLDDANESMSYRKYHFNSDWNVYLRGEGWEVGRYHNIVDTNLGEPLHADYTLYKEYYNYLDNNYKGNKDLYFETSYNQPMYVRFLNYKYLGTNNLLEHLLERGYVVGCVDIEPNRQQIIYWDRIRANINWSRSGWIDHYDYWLRKHIYEEKDGIVSEYIVYMLNEELYDDSVEKNFTIVEPAKAKNLTNHTWMLWYFISAFLSIICFSIYAVLITKQTIQKNKRALKLFRYLSSCLVAEYVTCLIILYCNLPLKGYDFNDFLTLIFTFTAYLCIIRIPLMVFVYKNIDGENINNYLIPQWLEKTINHFATSEAPLRAMLVFVLFPLFYICTLPCGIFALLYLIPAIVLYILVFFIIWIIKGVAIPVDKNNMEK